MWGLGSPKDCGLGTSQYGFMASGMQGAEEMLLVLVLICFTQALLKMYEHMTSSWTDN